MRPERTYISGQPAEWTEDIWQKWETAVALLPVIRILSANYYTPRPYVNEYDCGSSTEGFVYVIEGHYVCYHVVRTDNSDLRRPAMTP